MNMQLTRLDMNQFSLSAVDIADLPVATRQQVPSFQHLNFRGFIAGFACNYLENRACMYECMHAWLQLAYVLIVFMMYAHTTSLVIAFAAL